MPYVYWSKVFVNDFYESILYLDNVDLKEDWCVTPLYIFKL